MQHISVFSKWLILSLFLGVLASLTACSTDLRPGGGEEIYLDVEILEEALLYNTGSSRSGAKLLDSARVTGRIYLFVSDTNNVQTISYHLDNIDRSNPPFTSVSPGEAATINTTVLSNQTHTLTAAVKYRDGSSKNFTSTFLVDNAATLGDELLVSDYGNRVYSSLLNGSTVNKDDYIFLVPRQALSRVEFYLDDPGRTKAPRQTERYAFYDFGATGSSGQSLPISNKGVTDGSHTLTAVLYRTSGEVITKTATFSVGTSGGSPEPTPSPSPSPEYGPVQSPSIPSGAVYISPGQNINSIISSRPNGSTFVLRSGVHRGQTVRLSKGSKLIGEYGAVLSGARDVTSFSQSGSFWVLSGQTQQARVYDGPSTAAWCLDGYPACRHAEQVFINNQSLKQVTSLGDLSSGEFYFDYGADRIYLADDPRNKKVEVSYTERALIADDGASVSNLIIEKYNTSSLYASVTGYDNTTFYRNDIRFNGGVGLSVTDGAKVRRNRIFHNTRLGLYGFRANGTLVEANEISYNNASGHYFDYEAGGVKFIETNGLTIRQNYSHHNIGAGFWTDIANRNVLYENNRVTDNRGNGIFHELGYSAEVRYNVSERNKRGISINNSTDVKVHHNTLRDNVSGLYANNLCRSEAVTYKARNTTFYNNTVYQKAHVGPNSQWPSGKAAAFHVPTSCQYWSIPHSDFFDAMGNRWYNNTYYLSGQTSGSRPFFFWKDKERSYDEWRSFGQN